MACPRCGAEHPGQNGPCPQCAPVSPESDTATVVQGAPVQPLPPAPRPAPFLHFAPGQAFGERYTIVEEVGAGGMGQVYKVLDRSLGRPVALKLIRPEAAAYTPNIERFRRELALAREVTHTNVVRVYDLGQQDGLNYLTMEFVEGQSLEDLIQAVGHLSPRQTVALGRQICAGLAAIHERAIIHRDLKPGNIMVDRAGHARLMDFGMAYQHAQDRLTGAGGVMGTLPYLSPEQARGKDTDARSDIFAVGLILFEMLTGRRPPGDGAPLPLALRDSGERCPPPSQLSEEVPPPLDAVVMRCLERDPDRRYASAGEVEQALAATASSLSTGFWTTPLPRPQPSRRRRWLLGGGVAALAGLAAFLATTVPDHLPGRAPANQPAATVALLPLKYEGPAETHYLRESLPLILAERLRTSKTLDVAPFATSRLLQIEDDVRSAAKQLGVAFVVHGRLQNERRGLKASLEATRADGTRIWSQAHEGNASVLITAVDASAAALVSALTGGRPAELSPRPEPDPQALTDYLKGRALLEGWDAERNPQRAETAFRSAIALRADFAEAHAMLALSLLARYNQSLEPNLIPQAYQAAQRAVELAPENPEAHTALGLVELARGRSAEASAAFERGLTLAPGDDSLCRNIGRAYQGLERYQEAESYFQRAIDLRPSYWGHYNGKGTYHLRRGEFAKARELFSKVVELHPEGDTGYVNLALVYISTGEHQQAEGLLLSALRISPSSIAHNNLGLVYYATERYEEAAREWQAAIDSGERAAVAYSNLGDAYRRLGRRDEARRAYETAVSLGRERLSVNPGEHQAHAWLAMALAGVGRCSQAASEAALGVKARNPDPVHHYYAAVSHAICGQRAEAEQSIRRAIEAGALADVRTNPDLRPLLASPRIRELLAERASLTASP